MATKKIKPEELTFHYKKTESYRTYHADGFYGGLTPKGNLYMEIFLERRVTPKEEVYELGPQGNLAQNPLRKEGLTGLIREIEAGVIMDYNTMVLLKNWLDGKIKEYQEAYLPPNDPKQKN